MNLKYLGRVCGKVWSEKREKWYNNSAIISKEKKKIFFKVGWKLDWNSVVEHSPSKALCSTAAPHKEHSYTQTWVVSKSIFLNFFKLENALEKVLSWLSTNRVCMHSKGIDWIDSHSRDRIVQQRQALSWSVRDSAGCSVHESGCLQRVSAVGRLGAAGDSWCWVHVGRPQKLEFDVSGGTVREAADALRRKKQSSPLV